MFSDVNDAREVARDDRAGDAEEDVRLRDELATRVSERAARAAQEPEVRGVAAFVVRFSGDELAMPVPGAPRRCRWHCARGYHMWSHPGAPLLAT